MIVAQDIFVMLMAEPLFQTFKRKPVADATQSAEVVICPSVANRDGIAQLVSMAFPAGTEAPMPAFERGFMLQHGFEDPDGHLWELVRMDPATPAQGSP